MAICRDSGGGIRICTGRHAGHRLGQRGTDLSLRTGLGTLEAFVILLIVGGKFILDSRHENDAEVKSILKPLPIFLSAFATSIDACAVGFSLAMEEQPILVPALIFGVVTFMCSMICCYIGSKIGEKLGPRLLLIGGIVLILIGIKILISGLFEGLLPF